MKKYFYFIIAFIIIPEVNAGSGCGWGSFAGGFFGASLGNAMTQPRQVVVQQPVEREIIVQPSYNEYIERPQYSERPQRKKSVQRRKHEVIDEETDFNESKAWQAKADAERARTERIKAEIELEKLKNNN